MKRTGEKDSGLDWAEEILVTKSDLEASNIAKSELQVSVCVCVYVTCPLAVLIECVFMSCVCACVCVQAKVAELTLHHQYRLRLKDLNYAEKIKEVEDKFQEELAADKAKYSKLLSDKESMEGSYEDRIAAFEARQAREVSVWVPMCVLIDVVVIGVVVLRMCAVGGVGSHVQAEDCCGD